jgi:hypothetical protein
MKSEKGQAFPLALFALAIGSLVIAPFLGHVSSGLIGSRIYAQEINEQYSADAGVEHAIWQIKSGESEVPEGEGIELPESILNNKTVNVTIENEGEQIYKITSTATSDNGSSTTIESYISTSTSVFNNAITSQTDISLGKNCTVTGDIYYGGEFNYGKNFEHIDGEAIKGGEGEPELPSEEENEAFAQIYKDEALDGGTHEGNLTIPKSQGTSHLGPLYITGNLEVSKNNTLVLEGTIYVEGSINVDKDCEFAGSGSIVAVDNINLAKSNTYGTDGNSLIMSLTGNINFQKNITIEALIYAPNGTISFAKNSEVTGNIVGVNITADKNCSFTYDEDIGYWDDLPGGAGGLEIITWQILR